MTVCVAHSRSAHFVFCRGKRQALALLLGGLKRLEYRGYDSAGVGLIVHGKDGSSAMRVVKKQVREGSVDQRARVTLR